LEKDVVKYHGVYDEGYEPIRHARFERLKKMGLIRADCELSPQAGDWTNVRHKAWETRCMEVYAAMIDNMDQGIGRIVDTLQRHGHLDNTLLCYFQDNGGCAEGAGRKPQGEYTERPEKAPFPPMVPNALQFDMVPKQTRDGFPIIQGPGAMPGPDGTHIGYGRGWANVSNTPFREYKHWVHEGGIASPFIAHWPARIKRCGELDDQPSHLIDVMATCVDVADAAYPEVFANNRVKPMEGRSLAMAFDGKQIDREAIYWEHEGNRAVRVGKWKLVAKGEQGAWELYDIDEDRSEMHNLASEQPERVKDLAANWQAFAERANVLPLNPKPPKKTGKKP
jgi:arylsulfatase